MGDWENYSEYTTAGRRSRFRETEARVFLKRDPVITRRSGGLPAGSFRNSADRPEDPGRKASQKVHDVALVAFSR